ncbi:carbohydrate ABC transporter permease [Cellulosilyticum lentocellum]|uniref:ABC-type transporter, integral membrane subunit n=1 Tax=Cellulosilyticum lentocellum (strain ATCC 49066 / DSM 5427 / NCIMB 11756 / RHM5) TaxID=642492 RepID=F2JI19_CELLD|nr:sugar ABC transporter permease [Cellulosilyticum lentocellum]ADZ81963.1 ABC-type transporter, integral membrane subunit [Cellulosilyticum lentocellum DSM 5427]
MKKAYRWWEKIKDYLLFAGPITVAFFTVVIIPFLYGLFLTFTNWNGISSEYSIVGLENYKQIFSDSGFLNSLGLTFKYVIITVIITNVMAFTLAAILTSGTKGQNIFRAGFFTPNLIGGVALGYIWQFIFNNILTYFGTTYGNSFFASSLLSSPNRAFWALVIVSVWQYSGYMMLIYITGFLNLPKDVLEAASIDGAEGWARIKNVVLPLVMPACTISVFLTLQRTFMVYDVNMALTKGGPFKTTELISMFVYQKAFKERSYGIGQSQAVILFLIVAIISITQVYITKKREVEA